MALEKHSSSDIPESVPASESPADASKITTGGSKMLSMFANAAKVRHALVDQELKDTSYQRN